MSTQFHPISQISTPIPHQILFEHATPHFGYDRVTGDSLPEIMVTHIGRATGASLPEIMVTHIGRATGASLPEIMVTHIDTY